jgi:hypothetical protein
MAERKSHEQAIRAIDSVIGSMPAPKPVKAAPSPAPKKPEAPKQPSIADSILAVVKERPGITTAEIAAALPALNRKSIDNGVSSLAKNKLLTREGKGYELSLIAMAAE